MLSSPLRTLRARATVAGSMLRGPAASQKRFLSIHEHLSMGLLEKYGVPVPRFVAAHSADEAFKAAQSFGGKEMVIKAQVLAGGRGKGHFDSGLQGGVHLIKTAEEAKSYAEKMLGQKLITKQTGAGGRICNAVMLAEARPPKHEYYVALLNDRTTQLPVLVASNQGGMNIEEVAKDTPDAIITTPIDFVKGLDKETALSVAKKLGFSSSKQEEQAAETFIKLYKLFKEKDATQVEINPLAESKDGEVLCMDAKLGFDDNAAFRQKDIFKLRDITQEDPDEVEADKVGMNFIKLGSGVGCCVNGAGLAMATMDVLKLNGGEPANFLDVGGSVNAAAIKRAFELLTASKDVKAIFVNIFGGIVRCDLVSRGIVDAAKELDIKVPLVVRLQGTNAEEAKKILAESDVGVTPINSLDEAAQAAVAAARG
ncbi:unnamed protein product [Parajaminaea phylloscopi]